MLARTLLALRQACSSAGPLATRSLATDAAAAGATALPAAHAEGSKSKLMRILGEAAEPLTSDQVWEIAQSEGFPSKRYTKKMLQQLKEARLVVTKPMAGDGTNRKSGHRNFGYRLNLVQQRQRQARLEARAERDGSRRGLAAQ